MVIQLMFKNTEKCQWRLFKKTYLLRYPDQSPACSRHPLFQLGAGMCQGACQLRNKMLIVTDSSKTPGSLGVSSPWASYVFFFF